MKHRFNPHNRNKARGGSPQPSGGATLKQRGGMGSETAPPGAGSPGFRSALHSSGHGKGHQPLKAKIANNPSQFAQGGRRHGIHLPTEGTAAISKAKPQK